MDKVSYVGNADVNAIDHLYKMYLQDPESVDIGWKKFFEGFEFARTNFEDGEIPENFQKEFRVINLIDGYRSRGHLFTRTNPVRERRKYSPTLAIENFGLSEADLDVVFQAGEEVGLGPTTLRNIIQHLEDTYCESIGLEFMYIREPDHIAWFKNSIEIKNRPTFDTSTKKEVYRKLAVTTGFESFLG
jgi:2-oxoglutarate dehydrogenase E1 component